MEGGTCDNEIIACNRETKDLDEGNVMREWKGPRELCKDEDEERGEQSHRLLRMQAEQLLHDVLQTLCRDYCAKFVRYDGALLLLSPSWTLGRPLIDCVEAGIVLLDEQCSLDIIYLPEVKMASP